VETEQGRPRQILSYLSFHWVRHYCCLRDHILMSQSRPLKTFINEHKPRKSSRRSQRSKDIRPKQELPDESDVSAAESHSCPPAHLDGSAQESGSQTSSADNGGPQTPSPLYSEPVVAHVEVAQATESSAVDSSGVDPHFARLLSALTLSAKANGTGDERFDVPTTNTAILPSTAVGDARRSPQIRTTFASKTVVVAGDLAATVHPRPSSKLSKQSATAVNFNDTNFLGHSSSSSHVPPPPPGSLSTTTLGLSTSPSPNAKSPAHSRRSSMVTADLSPYLSRPAGIPMNGKRLRQLALLEAVADESARMTSVTPIHPAMKPQSPPREVFPALHHGPLPPNTVMPHNFTNLSPMYSNTHGSYLSSVPQTGHFNSPPPDNIFAVRPRTSNSFRPIPNHPPRPLNTRASMNQAQLLGALSGTPYPYSPGIHRPSIPPMSGPATHHLPPIPPVSLQTGPHLPATAGRGPPPPLRIPPTRAVSGPTPPQGLVSTPTRSSHFGLSHPTTGTQNSQLLNILNHGPGQ
jgi:mRNA-decapping enzyme subunit 2